MNFREPALSNASSLHTKFSKYVLESVGYGLSYFFVSGKAELSLFFILLFSWV